jgi:hypothetical protein
LTAKFGYDSSGRQGSHKNFKLFCAKNFWRPKWQIDDEKRIIAALNANEFFMRPPARFTKWFG